MVSNVTFFIQQFVTSCTINIQSLKALSSLSFQVDGMADDPEDPTVDIICASPFRAAVYDGTQYGIVVRNRYGSKV